MATEGGGRLDRELSLPGILGFSVVLIVLMALMFYLSWWLSGGLRRHLESMDPPPSPLPQAQAVQLPPEPRLQTRPEVDLQALREQESLLLHSYGWVEREKGLIRIPVEAAAEWIVQNGVPEFPPATGASGSGR